MRILHTADWHFGKTLEGRSRIGEQAAFVDELEQICIDEKVDLVLVAGDVYQTVNPSAQAEELFYEALNRLSNRGQRGMVVIAGNHDNPERLAAASPLAERLGITLIGLPQQDLRPELGRTSRVTRINSGASWCEVQIPNVAHSAVIAALPYPSEARLKELMSKEFDEQLWLPEYNSRITQIFQQLSRHYRKDTVNLGMSHLYVRGGIESQSEVQIQVGGTYAVNPDCFPEGAQYVALGHLHRPQWVHGAGVPIRYSGSPLAYSFSEAGYSKSVVIIDVEPGGTAEIRDVELCSGKPLVRWSAKSFDEVLTWVNEGRDSNAWIDLEIFLNANLTIEETFLLRSAHQGFVHIRPILPDMQHVMEVQAKQNLPIDELFVRYHERMRGFSPDERLIRLFMDLVSEDTSEEVDELEESAG